jgi:hypothetical protein
MKELKNYIDEENYDSALKFLKSNENIDAPILNYNLGFIYFKKENYVQARTYLEKAQYGGLRTKELKSALYRVKSELGIQNLEKSYSVKDEIMMETVGHHEDVFLALIGFVLFIALGLGITGKKFFSFVSSILFLAITSFYFFIQSYEIQINKEEIFVYLGPSKIFEQIQVISPGIKLITKKHEGNWSYISHPEMYRGWLFKSKVNKL